LRYDALASGPTVYAYVNGNPMGRRDPLGLTDDDPTPDTTTAPSSPSNAPVSDSGAACDAAGRWEDAATRKADAKAKGDQAAANQAAQDEDRAIQSYYQNQNQPVALPPTPPVLVEPVPAAGNPTSPPPPTQPPIQPIEQPAIPEPNL
jgi:hypothetical protein